jgi:hypothetical protein
MQVNKQEPISDEHLRRVSVAFRRAMRRHQSEFPQVLVHGLPSDKIAALADVLVGVAIKQLELIGQSKAGSASR